MARAEETKPSDGEPRGRSDTRRRRRRRGAAGGRRPPKPQTLEDVVLSIRGTPDRLSAPSDGQRLEDVIGELQSIWGVPQYPQEYRLLIKVAEERAGASSGVRGSNGVTRERAPAAPRVAGGPAGAEAAGGRERAPRRRRRSRRGRRRRGSGDGS